MGWLWGAWGISLGVMGHPQIMGVAVEGCRGITTPARHIQQQHPGPLVLRIRACACVSANVLDLYRIEQVGLARFMRQSAVVTDHTSFVKVCMNQQNTTMHKSSRLATNHIHWQLLHCIILSGIMVKREA